eukprot:TRINITY_DN14412_c0_g1_i1.p1 TRINITY_DN14412_c0_g1~~TRINITY_DN14412_c0_g1_i1.p1  ORF type:complete len:400 (-),score=66.02 TRINITY_DN14412_c0_g1_i1:298-1497(-)
MKMAKQTTLVFVAWLIATASAGECTTELDCSLNGVCTAGQCACDAPWKDSTNGAESCSVLDVVPHPDNYVPAYGGPRVDTAFGPQNVTSWGGNAILGSDGQYHLFVSAMGGGKGLDTWTSNSQIDHAVASDPMGVFIKVDTSLSSEAHNASPLRLPNGTYLLFHIGSAGVSKGGSNFLHASEHPEGPWRPLPGLSCNNPAPMLHNNGTVFVGCNNGGFKIYRSEDPFSGGWIYETTLDFPPAWGSDAPGELRNEDPYMWMDSRGNWHFLAHRYDYRDGWPVNPNQTMPMLVSGHGFSTDGVDWKFNSAQQPYAAEVSFQNGTVQQFSTFERPHLVFNEQRQLTHLVNGVSPYWDPPGAAGPCDGCDARQGSAHSCVVCKTTKGIDYTYTLVSKLNLGQQ